MTSLPSVGGTILLARGPVGDRSGWSLPANAQSDQVPLPGEGNLFSVGMGRRRTRDVGKGFWDIPVDEHCHEESEEEGYSFHGFAFLKRQWR